MSDLVEKWKSTGLLDDADNKKELAEMLEETHEVIVSTINKNMHDDTINGIALSLVRKIYCGNGEEWFDVKTLLSELYVRKRVINLFLKEPCLAEHEATYIQDNSPHFPPEMTEGLVRSRMGVSKLDLEAELRNIISEYIIKHNKL